ncbi:MAG TPA: CcmD family protein [Ferruginibacter sp.]|nr:CcmD family protein [Ferruginibacter sp.]HMP20775.1 CcmD family protein [Ferruginibacter sp.]
MKTSSKIITVFLLMLCLTTSLFAQQTDVEMADTMRSNGKIYIVVAVCLTILAGLFFYVWRIDRKLSEIEKQEQ